MIRTNAPTDQHAISVRNLTVSYGPVPALLDISVDIEPSQLVGVIGPNGSGKSTFIKSILGFIKPDHGTVAFFGDEDTNASGRIAYVPQRGSVLSLIHISEPTRPY